jgi:hypothetical protein
MGFLESTRQNFRQAGSENYVSAGQSLISIPRVGYLSKVAIHVTGTMTITPGTGTAVLSEKGPWALLRRIRYQIGSGTELFNTSGYGAYLCNTMLRYQYVPENGQVSASFSNQVYQAGVASGANAWDFFLVVPITPNDRDLLGLILLQAEGTVTNLLLEWQVAGGATSDFPVVLTGNATAVFAGRADVYIETFTVPAEIENQAPLDRVYQTIETVSFLGAVGANSIKLLEENTYLRIIHSIEVNGALSTDALESMLFRYNVTDVPYEIDKQTKLFQQRYEYGKDFPKGMFYWDFFNQGYPNYGGDRDLVMASGLAELESILRIAAGTTFGSNNNLVRTISQQIVRVGSPVAQPA